MIFILACNRKILSPIALSNNNKNKEFNKREFLLEKMMMKIIIKCTHEKSIKFDSDELFENFPFYFVALFKFKIVHHRQCRCYSFHGVNVKALENF